MYVKPAVITLVVFLLGKLQFYFLFLAFGLKINVVEFILAASLVSTLELLPSGIPMKLGQSEVFGILILPYLLGVDKNIVFSLLLLQRAVSIGLVAVFGFLSLNFLGLDIRSVKRHIRETAKR